MGSLDPFPLYFSSLSTEVYISIHAVSCSEVSMHEFLFCKVLHSLCYINAHLNQDLQLYTLDREDSKTKSPTMDFILLLLTLKSMLQLK